jgi:hypothetical protein
VLPSKSVPTTGRGSGKRKRGVDKDIEDGDGPSQGSEHDTPIDNAIVQVGEDMHVNGLRSNAPQEKRSKKEVYSL